MKVISVDPDEMPYFASSHLDLHFLLVSNISNARHQWVSMCSTQAYVFVLMLYVQVNKFSVTLGRQ